MMNRLKFMVVWAFLILNTIFVLSNCNEQRPSQNSEPNSIAVTYIGNEGFMVEFPSKKILIDALTSHENPSYTTPASDDLIKMESGQPPFGGTDLVLVTHHHLDHYSPASSVNCLLNNSGTEFLSTQQAVELLKENATSFEKIEKRVIEVTPDFEQSIDVRVDGIDLRVLRLKHSAYYEEKEDGTKVNRHEHVQNLGFLVRTDGLAVFHCGDARTDPEEFKALGLDEERVDIAFLHLRFFFDPVGKEIIEYMKPGYVVLMHIGPEYLERVMQAVSTKKEAYPNITVFSESMQKEIFHINTE
jgi:L-ascorbate metabolism protein UlaG (beta-lactamase superfamily)